MLTKPIQEKRNPSRKPVAEGSIDAVDEESRNQ
jgi:hypothetical protein